MPGQHSFNYTVIRVVPFVERQEFVNVGIILHCKKCNFLKARISNDLDRIKILFPKANLIMIKNQLESISTICRGDPEAGFFSSWSTSERFDWLASPSSTVIQTSPMHAGICSNAETALNGLYNLMITG